jgi:type I restriction enzyme S subunit
MISQEQFGNFQFALPTPAEQTAIADYLDAKTAAIDELIAAKQKLIELYEEEKTALINHAVTKGLNPNATMKDSGIDWLGEIPEHWSYMSLKHLVSIKITDGPHETPVFVGDGVPFVSVEAVKNGKIDFDYKRGYISKDLDIEYSKKCKPQKDDIFIVKSGSTTGKIAYIDFDADFNIWSPLALVRSNNKIIAKYFYYALVSEYFQKQVQLNWSFGTQPNIGMNVIENLRITLSSSKEEQRAIVKYIETESRKIDTQIANATQLIELLTEYRTVLISEVVTGKIKVAN